jgi:hypothetical protein
MTAHIVITVFLWSKLFSLLIILQCLNITKFPCNWRAVQMVPKVCACSIHL